MIALKKSSAQQPQERQHFDPASLRPTCIICQEKGHWYTSCKRRLTQPLVNVLAFSGKMDVLSNFYPCKIEVFDMIFPSAEHAYQYTKAMMCGCKEIASKIYNAPTAWKAKQLSRLIKTTEQWEADKYKHMLDINRAKCDNIEEYYNILVNSKDVLIAEAVPGDKVWSCGLSKAHAAWYKPEDWPGRNRMGQIHMLIRNEILTSHATTPMETATSRGEVETL